MELRVIGCHGGETPRHRTCAFLLDGRVAIDAGSLTSGLEIAEQAKLQACLVSHAHLDHVRDLATLADNRCQLECPPLIVAATKPTLVQLQKYFFNNELWPDFTVIPSPSYPTVRFVELAPEVPQDVCGLMVSAVMVSHTIDCSGFIVDGGASSLSYSGDTGPTDRMWELLNEKKNLKACLMEVSFPDRHQRIATLSGHHTPRTLRADLQKYRAAQDLPTMLYHIKPLFQAEVERECAALPGLNLHVLKLDEHFIL